MNMYEEDLYEVFKREIIQHKEDTRNQRWRYKCEQVLSDIANHDINLLSPKDCVSQVINQRKTENLIQALEQLENAFYCISQYAINLCRDPKRPEYKLIKSYNGFYASNIHFVMNGTDTMIIKSMGYQIKDGCENDDEFTLRSPTQNITRLAFELFLAQPYCQFLRNACRQVYGKFQNEAVVYMLECGVKKILKYGAENLCDKWMKKYNQKLENDGLLTNDYTSSIDNTLYHSALALPETTNFGQLNIHDDSASICDNSLYKSVDQTDYADIVRSKTHQTKAKEDKWVAGSEYGAYGFESNMSPILSDRTSSISSNRVSSNQNQAKTTYPDDFIPKAYQK